MMNENETFPGLDELIYSESLQPKMVEILNLLWKWSPAMLIVAPLQAYAPHAVKFGCQTKSIRFSECPSPSFLLERSGDNNILWLYNSSNEELLGRYLREMDSSDEVLNRFIKKFRLMMIFDSTGRFQSLNCFKRNLSEVSVEWYTIVRSSAAGSNLLSHNYGKLPDDFLHSLSLEQITALRSLTSPNSLTPDIVNIMMKPLTVSFDVSSLMKWTDDQGSLGYGFHDAVLSFRPTVDSWLIDLSKSLHLLPYNVLKKIVSLVPPGHRQLCSWLKVKWCFAHIGFPLPNAQKINFDFDKYLSDIILKHGFMNEESESLRELKAIYNETPLCKKQSADSWIKGLMLQGDLEITQ